MGFTRNVSDLITEVRSAADMTNSQFVTDTEIVAWINNAYRRMYNILVNAYENYKVSSKDLTTVAGTTQYALEANFLKLLKVFYVASDGREVPLRRIPMEQMGTYTRYDYRPRTYTLIGEYLYMWPMQTSGQTIRYYYVPCASALTSGSTAVDFSMHMDEYVVLAAAVKCLEKEKSPCQELMRDRDIAYQDCIDAAAPRDASEAVTVTDVIYERNYELDSMWD